MRYHFIDAGHRAGPTCTWADLALLLCAGFGGRSVCLDLNKGLQALAPKVTLQWWSLRHREELESKEEGWWGVLLSAVLSWGFSLNATMEFYNYIKP